MYETYSLSTDDSRYELSALVTENGYELPYLLEKPVSEIESDGGMGNELENDLIISESGTFLLHTLYPKIKECISNKSYSSFDDWWTYNEGSVLEHFYLDQLIKMFEKAIELGFFEHIQEELFRIETRDFILENGKHETGIKDRKGNIIFLGDIVQDEKENKNLVVYRNGSYAFKKPATTHYIILQDYIVTKTDEVWVEKEWVVIADLSDPLFEKLKHLI